MVLADGEVPGCSWYGRATLGGGVDPPPSVATAAAMGRPPQEENLYCYCCVRADPYVDIYGGDPGI